MAVPRCLLEPRSGPLRSAKYRVVACGGANCWAVRVGSNSLGMRFGSTEERVLFSVDIALDLVGLTESAFGVPDQECDQDEGTGTSADDSPGQPGILIGRCRGCTLGLNRTIRLSGTRYGEAEGSFDGVGVGGDDPPFDSEGSCWRTGFQRRGDVIVENVHGAGGPVLAGVVVDDDFRANGHGGVIEGHLNRIRRGGHCGAVGEGGAFEYVVCLGSTDWSHQHDQDEG